MVAVKPARRAASRRAKSSEAAILSGPQGRARFVGATGRWLLALAVAGLATPAAVGACGSSTYGDVQETWTRAKDAYDGFEVKAFAAATLKVLPFRRAYVDEYARLFALTKEQREAMLENERDEDRRSLVVMVAFYTPQTAWNDLNPARGIWEVRLESGPGDIVHPFAVTRVSQQRNPTWQALFPYVGAHHVFYELKFERDLPDGRPFARGGDRVDLVIAGAPTQLRLAWKMP